MNDIYYKVLQSGSLPHLQRLLEKAKTNGWQPVGNIDLFKGKFVQPIKFSGYEDDTTEMITVENVEN